MVGGITELLVQWGDGNQAALDQLMPLVYDELRRLASAYLHREQRHITLQPTALVHETYLRLVDQTRIDMRNRAQFYGLAAQVMRHVLVDYARQRQAAKRGGTDIQISLTSAESRPLQPDVNLVALDDALNELVKIKPEHCRVVELRFFGGLTIEEMAEVLGTSHSTVERQWAFAKAWLRRELSR